MHGDGRKIVVVVVGLILGIPFLSSLQRRPAEKAVQRLFEQAKVARAKLPYEKDGGGVPHLEQYIEDLKRIDLKGVPQPVRQSFVNYIQSMEEVAHIRRTGGNTNRSEEIWGKAETQLLWLISKHTTDSYYYKAALLPDGVHRMLALPPLCEESA